MANMEKILTKAESQLIGWAIVIGLPIYGIAELGESVGWGDFSAMVAVMTIIVILFNTAKKKKRRKSLMVKYNDSALVDSLLKGLFWQGQTSEQLQDSLGAPADIEQKIVKTRKKEIWKYYLHRDNRYGLSITLDNDLVVGWDQKT